MCPWALWMLLSVTASPGNILLKSIEGTAMYMGSMIKHMFKRNPLSMLGYLLCKSGVKELSQQLDYRHVGGTAAVGHPQAGHQSAWLV